MLQLGSDRSSRGRARLAALACAAGMLAALSVGCGRPKPKGRALRASELNAQGVNALRRGDLLVAEDSFRTALGEAEAIDDRVGRAVALINLGRVHLELWILERARERFEDAADLAAATRDVGLRSLAIANLARVHSLAGAHEKALRAARRALDLAHDDRSGRKKERRAAIAGRLVTLAWVSWRSGGTGCAHAAKALEKAGATFARLKDLRGRAAVAYNSAMLALEAGRPADAKTSLLLALGLDRKRDAALDVGADLRGLAEAAVVAGNRREAVAYLERALRVHVALDATHRALADLERLASLHRKTGNDAAATYLDSRADEIREDMGSIALARTRPTPPRGCGPETP